MQCNNPWQVCPFLKPFLDIHNVCLHIVYTCDYIMYPVRYLLTGLGEIGWRVPKQNCKFWAKKSSYENSNTQLALCR